MGVFDNQFARGDAMQDQEVAAALEWYREQDPADILKFFDALNDGTPETMRQFSDAYLHIMRTLTIITFYEIARRACERERC